MNNKWKEYLLKSGVPLEYEVKTLLESYSVLTSYEQTYLRKDESNIETEFSYDLDCAYVKELNHFNLMIECKYRNETTNWLFLPDVDSRNNSLTFNSILHPNDYFTESNKFHFELFEMPYLAPICAKGIEITSDGQNPKSITQAINQLSYAMAQNMVEGFKVHLESNDGMENVIFFQIPIIVTTANLYRLKRDISISEIKNCSKIEDIAQRIDSLILTQNIGKDLETYNKSVFSEIIKRFDKQFLNRKLTKYKDGIEQLIEVLSKYYCPQSILVINHSPESKGFHNLINLLDEIAIPTIKTIKFVRDKQMKKFLKDELQSRQKLNS
jgi:hypothetical protein